MIAVMPVVAAITDARKVRARQRWSSSWLCSMRSRRRTIPFVGRGSELTIVSHTLSRVSSSGGPALVTIVGEPGIGKSRLVLQFCEEMATTNTTILHADFVKIDRSLVEDLDQSANDAAIVSAVVGLASSAMYDQISSRSRSARADSR